uniref:Uncharacterized protein n=1 Tax=Populus alba TaxID=43335 RepID=A0A4U5P1U2_POPAL|nr:hypothetical protein D5086_0000238010 [Populus alba]
MFGQRWSCGCRRCGPGVVEGARPVLGEEEDAAAACGLEISGGGCGDRVGAAVLSQGNERERMALRVWLLVCAGEMRWLLSCLASRPEKRKKKTPPLQGAVVLLQ